MQRFLDGLGTLDTLDGLCLHCHRPSPYCIRIILIIIFFFVVVKIETTPPSHTPRSFAPSNVSNRQQLSTKCHPKAGATRYQQVFNPYQHPIFPPLTISASKRAKSLNRPSSHQFNRIPHPKPPPLPNQPLSKTQSKTCPSMANTSPQIQNAQIHSKKTRSSRKQGRETPPTGGRITAPNPPDRCHQAAPPSSHPSTTDRPHLSHRLQV